MVEIANTKTPQYPHTKYTWRHIPEQRRLHQRHCKNFRYSCDLCGTKSLMNKAS